MVEMIREGPGTACEGRVQRYVEGKEWGEWSPCVKVPTTHPLISQGATCL